MKNYIFIFLSLFVLFNTGCIKDDIVFDTVDPVIRITNPIDTIAQDSQYVFEIEYFNNVGKLETTTSQIWSSSAPDIIEISSAGIAKGVVPGSAMIKVELTTPDGIRIEDELFVVVGENTVIVVQVERIGSLATTSSYVLEGDFMLTEIDGQLKLIFDDTYKASSALPGLFVYLTNNPNTVSGATEIQKVTVFSGAHDYDIPSSIEIDDFKYVLYFCKPFNVKVGDGEFEN